jgi:hypothetical protein
MRAILRRLCFTVCKSLLCIGCPTAAVLLEQTEALFAIDTAAILIGCFLWIRDRHLRRAMPGSFDKAILALLMVEATVILAILVNGIWHRGGEVVVLLGFVGLILLSGLPIVKWSMIAAQHGCTGLFILAALLFSAASLGDSLNFVGLVLFTEFTISVLCRCFAK